MSELAIETKHLGKDYGDVRAVESLDLRVPRGSIYGFLGPNGAGKTTTIKMLLGMAAPSRGQGWVFGLRIDRPEESLEIRRQTGFVSEDKGLYDFMTVGRLIAFARPFFPAWREDLERQYLRSFDLPLNRKVKNLSKGMRTKLALLLALARGGRLLILDEPTEGLDPAMIEEVLQILVGLVSSTELTIFFSSHQLAEVEQIADRVCILHRGRMVVEGALDELKEAYRRVHLVFDREPPPEIAKLDGVARAARDKNEISLLVSRNLDEIVRRARELNPVSIDVASVTFKEIFLQSVKEEKVEPDRRDTHAVA